MLDGQESEIELRNELASGFRQFGPDRLRFLEFRNVVAAEAAVTADETFAGVQILLIRASCLSVFASFDIRGVVPQEFERDVVERRRIDLRQRLLFPVRILQRRQIGRDVRSFFIASVADSASSFPARPVWDLLPSCKSRTA